MKRLCCLLWPEIYDPPPVGLEHVDYPPKAEESKSFFASLTKARLSLFAGNMSRNLSNGM